MARMREAIQKNRRTLISVVLILVAFSSGLVVGTTHPALLALAQSANPGDSKLFQPFWEAWNLLHENYVDPLDDSKLLASALTGMMNAPGDRFTNYFDPTFYKSTTDEMAGQFSGIGATVKKDDKTGGLLIVSTLDGSPARAAGLQTGDLILTVDGQDITAMAEQDIIGKVHGAAGTVVNLGIVRAGSTAPITIPITRQTIALPDVTTALYKDYAGKSDIGYISLSEFGDHASADFAAGLKKLNADHLKGLIFDLRGNPGGYLTAAIDIASDFMPTGTVLIERGRDNSENTYKVTGKSIAPHVPMVVLVDGGSASAAELVSGALQDNGRAELIGVRTFGKGSVQIIQPLSNGGAAHITIARWFTPKGRTIERIGLTPDLIMGYDPVAQPNGPDWQLQEAILVLRGEL
ncbi:MAG: S41 family peptidase [Aggregatilineales bacterium]